MPGYHNSINRMSGQEAELVDLPDEDEDRPKVPLSKVCSPKIIVLLIASSYFVAMNVYNYMQKPQEERPASSKYDFWGDFWKMAEQMYGYMIVCVIGFVILVFLMRANDQYEIDKMEKARKEEEAKEEDAKQRLMEREAKIMKKLEEEEKQEQLRQAAMAAGGD